jgi:putative (di)nucleoside polyphosphate hydrolase
MPIFAHHPPQHVVDEQGLKWRLCVGVVIFNSKNEILVGEPIGKQGSWQAPQGGVDSVMGKNGKLETLIDAAKRELYEQVGLETGKHVLLEKIGSCNTTIKCRYKTEGTGSWLENKGFSGQELNWTFFRCADSNLERDPSLVCNLSRLNGESAEFCSMKWMSLDCVVENLWETKRGHYEALRMGSAKFMKNWINRCQEIALDGKWHRDSTRSEGLVEALMSRGISEEKALMHAAEPYVQLWMRLNTVGQPEYEVRTFERDTDFVRRKLVYPLGKFTEMYEGTSMLFGGSDGGLIHRHCFYLAEADADGEIAHVTVSLTPRGREESTRYLRDGELILRRSFWHSWGTEKVVSTEVFVRC